MQLRIEAKLDRGESISCESCGRVIMSGEPVWIIIDFPYNQVLDKVHLDLTATAFYCSYCEVHRC